MRRRQRYSYIRWLIALIEFAIFLGVKIAVAAVILFSVFYFFG